MELHLGFESIAQVVRNGCHSIKIFSQAVHNHVFLLYYHIPYDHDFGGKVQANVLACGLKDIRSIRASLLLYKPLADKCA